MAFESTPTTVLKMSAARYSIIVPAFRENGNLRPLVTRIFAAVSQPGSSVNPAELEVIIVDDNSRDGSVETVESLRHEGYNARIIVRTSERGLSSAVVRGFREARGEKMLCMDADLQVSLIPRARVTRLSKAWQDGLGVLSSQF